MHLGTGQIDFVIDRVKIANETADLDGMCRPRACIVDVVFCDARNGVPNRLVATLGERVSRTLDRARLAVSGFAVEHDGSGIRHVHIVTRDVRPDVRLAA